MEQYCVLIVPSWQEQVKHAHMLLQYCLLVRVSDNEVSNSVVSVVVCTYDNG